MAVQLAEWTALAPSIVLAVTAFVLFLIDSVDPDDANSSLLAGTATLGSLVALAVAGWFLVSGTGQPSTGGAITLFDGALVVDGMSLFFVAIFASVTALVTVASWDYVRGHEHEAEYYLLVLLAATGMSLMASSNSLATVFISLELSSLPSYALVAYLKDDRSSVESSMKYFLIGALSTAIMVFGISLVYAATGSLQLAAVGSAVGDVGNLVGVLGIGVLMVLGGFAFKTSSVPFHFWAPDAYEGAPAPISAFLSSASKAAGFVVAFRVFVVAFPAGTMLGMGIDWVLAFQILAVVTMLLGNFAAAVQTNVKRMLAYSSVGQAGYVLIGLAALTGGQNALLVGASMIHLFVYGFMNTGAFLFVALAEYWGVGRRFEDYNGLGKQAPVASVAMSIFLVSLAGLPAGAGALSKWVLFSAAVGAGYWWLAAIGVVVSVLSLFYYSRVIWALWMEDPVNELPARSRPVGLYVAIVGAAIVTFGLLVFFNPIANTAVNAATALFA